MSVQPVQDEPSHPSPKVVDALVRGLARLGLTPMGRLRQCPTLMTRPERQVVRTFVTREGLRTGRRRPPRPREVAVKVLLGPQETTRRAFAWEHRLAVELHAVAEGLLREGVLPHNPIVRVLHTEPIDLGDSCVAVSRFVKAAGGPLPVTAWARTLGMLHRVGSTGPALDLLREHPATNVLFGLRAEAMLMALRRPGHPLRGEVELVRRYAKVLRERATRAVALDPQPLLVHRDFHPLNCLNANPGPVAIDWQDAGWGNRSDDFAWLHLSVRRFGRPESLVEEARQAYALVADGLCPSPEQIYASGQVLELLCLGFSIMNADRGPQYFQEFLAELPILDHPDARTGPWKMLNNPRIFDHAWAG